MVGLRHSPGRITRGALNNLFAPLSVQGPMARCVADVALFLDTMAGWCPLDPLTYDAPAGSYAQAVVEAERHRPRSIAFTTGFNGQLPVDRETHEICAREMRRFEALGCIVEEVAPNLGELVEAFLVLRSQSFVVDRELQLQTMRDQLKPDII